MGKMTIITTEQPSQAGHWYDAKTGQPAYTIIGKNGKERNTTLADAKRLRPTTILVPGATTVSEEGNRPGLNNWKEEQVMLSALTLPRLDGEIEAEWIKRVRADAKETGKKAAERGTEIHSWIQQGLEGHWDQVTPLGYDYYHAVKEELERQALTGNVILDIKTKENPEKFALYDDMYKQLAAYQNGLAQMKLQHVDTTWHVEQSFATARYGGKVDLYMGNNPLVARCGILFVSVEPITAKLMWCEETHLERGWKMFEALLDHYYARTGLGHDAP